MLILSIQFSAPQFLCFPTSKAVRELSKLVVWRSADLSHWALLLHKLVPETTKEVVCNPSAEDSSCYCSVALCLAASQQGALIHIHLLLLSYHRGASILTSFYNPLYLKVCRVFLPLLNIRWLSFANSVISLVKWLMTHKCTVCLRKSKVMCNVILKQFENLVQFARALFWN